MTACPRPHWPTPDAPAPIPDPPDERRHIGDALHADAALDVALAAYAEHGADWRLAAALCLARQVVRALEAEAVRVERARLG